MSTHVDATSWQEEAFKAGASTDNFLLDAPGGAGKSLVQCALAAHDLRNDPRRKQLICVPQSHISQGFASKSINIGGHTLDWRLDHNLCSLSQKRVACLKRFLLGNRGGTAICTHAGLTRLWVGLTGAEKRRAVELLTLTLDEAHHLSGVMTDDDLSAYALEEQAELLEVCPRLSEIVRLMIGRQGCRLRLATATFFRGDQAIILGDDVQAKFTEYRLRWEDYFPLTGIESIRFTFELYEGDPLPRIVQRVKEEPSRRHLIILPKKGNRFCSVLTAERLVGSLADVLGSSCVLDLVTVKTQRRNKRLLSEGSGRYHAIVSCCLFNRLYQN